LFRLLNTRESASGRALGEKFAIAVNAATKRPLPNNKPGSSEKQAGRGIQGADKSSAGAVIRAGRTSRVSIS
jgi:hypothetical protein